MKSGLKIYIPKNVLTQWKIAVLKLKGSNRKEVLLLDYLKRKDSQDIFIGVEFFDSFKHILMKIDDDYLDDFINQCLEDIIKQKFKNLS